jgi:hypothetical protein
MLVHRSVPAGIAVVAVIFCIIGAAAEGVGWLVGWLVG